MVSSYEKMTVDGKTSIYMIIAESPSFLLVKKVDKEGSEREDHYKGETLIEVVHMIDPTLITKRIKMVMNLKYGELEKV